MSDYTDVNASESERAAEAALRPKRLSEFVGQEIVRDQLSLVLDAAIARGKSPDHVLLSGPLPVLNQVNADIKLVRVLADVTGLEPGSHEVTPTLIVPEGLRSTVVPSTIQVRIERPTSTPSP